MNKRHYEHTLPNIRGSLSNTYDKSKNSTYTYGSTYIGYTVSRNYTPCPFSYSVPIFYFCPIGPLVRYTTVFNFYKK